MKKEFLFNPKNPKKSFDVYIDKNPKDTIPIKFSTVKDVNDTIKKLESLYKSNKYPHKRISQVAMILRVRLRAIFKNNNKGKDRLNIAEKYVKFLKERTKIKSDKDRKKLIFKSK